MQTAQGNGPLGRRGIGPVDFLHLIGPCPEPLYARTLRIIVHDRSPHLLAGIETGKIGGQGGLP